jgi:hypothetical protein
VRAIRAGLILVLVQVVLVLSVAGKYLYERQTRPRVWTRAAPFDPALPLRGRYLALQLMLDACGLPRDAEHTIPGYGAGHPFWQWHVSLTTANGKLVPRLEKSWSPRTGGRLTLFADKPCDQATLSNEVMLFIPDRAQLPFPLRAVQELWVEVTLPQSGPPRPIQIALSGAGGFHPVRQN